MVGMKVDSIRFSHGRESILKGISFEVGCGEIVAILGENGSGKTTLLNCINTEYLPDEGSVVVSDIDMDQLVDCRSDSVDVSDLTDSDRSRILATVEQNSQQSFPFSVMETVRMGRYSRAGMFDDDDDGEMDLICSVMEETGIIHLSDRTVEGLSGGEWRRVMIAQALAQEPQILLLDEPTLHLDVCHQFDLMDMCRRIVRGRNILIVIVTHDLQLAARYADRVIVMRKGEIYSMGPARDVITEDMVREIFHMESRIGYDPDVEGVNVVLLRRCRDHVD